jgi:NADH-quinone oxidoreductase subunit G
LLVQTRHTGKPNNGLVMVWDKANIQGAWDMGFRPTADLAHALLAAKGYYVAAADPAADDPRLAQLLAQRGEKPLIVHELFLTETARLADVVFPAQSFTEREGSFTSGERRVQHFFEAIPPMPETRPDYAITAQVGDRLGLKLERRAAWLVMQRIAETIPAYAGITYEKLGRVQEQYPLIGRHDLYYGGTSYDNTQGLGVKLPAAHESGDDLALPPLETSPAIDLPTGALLAVPIARLYDRGQTVLPSTLLHQRLAAPQAILHPRTAASLGCSGTELIRLHPVDGEAPLADLPLALDDSLPEGVVAVPLSTGIPLRQPCAVKCTLIPAAIPVIE